MPSTRILPNNAAKLFVASSVQSSKRNRRNEQMNWKRLVLIAVIAAGFAFVSAPRSEAGVSVGIGLGVPVGYGYGYGGYYGYTPAYYPYGSPYGYYSPVRVVVRPHYHWRHGHRIYCTARHGHWR